MTQPIWNTTAGSLGVFPSLQSLSVSLSATAQSPATQLIYKLLNGSLPSPLAMSTSGVITGTPDRVTSDITSTFTVRVTDDLLNIRDRTFTMKVSGAAVPKFLTSEGELLNTWDSVWVDIPIIYSNPEATNKVSFELAQGRLPPGLTLLPTGAIQGYASPPIESVSFNLVNTVATSTTSGTNIITCDSTSGMAPGRQIIFTGTVYGGIESAIIYFVDTVINSSSFTIATAPGGAAILLSDGSGSMDVELPSTSVGQPTKISYPFKLRLRSDLGTVIASFSITVVNQNAGVVLGGPAMAINSRTPVILNTKPLTPLLTNADPYFGYYLLDDTLIGTIVSDDYFSFKVNGYDFDNSPIQYSYSGLPSGLIGDPDSGWVSGAISIAPGISRFSFSASVYKKDYPGIASEYLTFYVIVTNGVSGKISWETPADLGRMFNGERSTLKVSATASIPLSYRLISGSLPANLTLLDTGEIIGIVSEQPTETLLSIGDSITFTFAVQAYSTQSSVIQLDKEFTINVVQEYDSPTETVYIKAVPSFADRKLINSLLTDPILIPMDNIYRPTDPEFGKATSVIYDHAYGITVSDLTAYLAAITTNHYWRNITLGEIKTAVAKNAAGEIIYEVVYSEVIDNLASLVPVNKTKITTVAATNLYWPRPINLLKGPWYTSITDIYTSYDFDLTYYTSLSPGYVRMLYPNSLLNMRNQVSTSLGQEFDSKLLPRWMTSQQPNGSTLGYTPAWVIAFTLPGKSEAVKNNIQSPVTQTAIIISSVITITTTDSPTKVFKCNATSSTSGFYVDMPIRFTGNVFGGVELDKLYYIRSVLSASQFTVATAIIKDPETDKLTELELTVGSGTMQLEPVTWGYTLNQLNFKIDRFLVDKSQTFNYDQHLNPAAWTNLPAASPTPNPSDSADLCVLFPRKTILPNSDIY